MMLGSNPTTPTNPTLISKAHRWVVFIFDLIFLGSRANTICFGIKKTG
ncbi:hypothetical protein ACFL11_00120 [Patescibacteria group bacterium]